MAKYAHDDDYHDLREDVPRHAPIPRSEYPLWVKFSTWGVPGRNGLWFFVVVSLLAAVGFTYLMVSNELLSRAASAAGILASLGAAFAYWGSMRWIDRN
jgi:hypothetical protein